MAGALDIPLCDMTFEDIKKMYSFKEEPTQGKEGKTEWKVSRCKTRKIEPRDLQNQPRKIEQVDLILESSLNS